MERFDDKCDNLNDDRLDFRMFLNLFSQLTQIHIQLQHSILHKPLNLTIQNIHLSSTATSAHSSLPKQSLFLTIHCSQ